jgi:hypothetical protein
MRVGCDEVPASRSPLLRIAFKSTPRNHLTDLRGRPTSKLQVSSLFVGDAEALPGSLVPGDISDDVVDVLLAAQSGKGYRGRRFVDYAPV